MEESSSWVFSSCASRSRSTWGKKARTGESKWGAKDNSSSSSWGQGAKDKETNSWRQQKEFEGQGWNAKGSSWGAKSGGLIVQTEQDQDYKSTGGDKSSWEVKTPNTCAWGASSKWGKVSSLSPTGEKKDLFNSPKKIKSTRWGREKVDNDYSSQHVQGRGRGRDGGDWGRGRRGRGWESFGGRGNGDWKNNRSPRPAYDPSKSSILTMTRLRLDMFSDELQDVLMETEAIMKNIRRIMSLREYSDGDPLPEDDQKYIIENVFNYHPDKAVKTGAGLDHITVDNHKEFKESRCFHAVTIDGNKVDFSYFKCLENYVKEKYPDKAEEFLPMYFKRRQPRGVFNKEQSPGSPRMSSHARWSKDQGSEPRTSSPVGYNKNRGPGTPRMSSQ